MYSNSIINKLKTKNSRIQHTKKGIFRWNNWLLLYFCGAFSAFGFLFGQCKMLLISSREMEENFSFMQNKFLCLVLVGGTTILHLFYCSFFCSRNTQTNSRQFCNISLVIFIRKYKKIKPKIKQQTPKRE